ncbi:MAG: C39 family peptidase [Anaerolineaceae bacterium]
MAKTSNKSSVWRKPWVYLGILAALGLIALGLYQIPSIHTRAYYHLATIRAKIFYYFNPPTENVFNPIGNQNPTSLEIIQTPTTLPTATAVPELIITPLVPPTATPVPTPLPDSVELGKITLQPQAFNNCGPATLSMNLEYWGWDGDQSMIQRVIKPRLEDLAVMPAELKSYVDEHTDFKMIIRRAGSLETIKELISVDIPVMIERGYFIVSDGWMGHFGVINGYNDATQTVHIPDSFSGVIDMSYSMLQGFWDEFNNTYMIVFPPEREAEVMALLGPDADPNYNQQSALQRAEKRLADTNGKPQFFAAYSKGIVLNEMQRYSEAAEAFDLAFALYAKLDSVDRPWRMIWYEPAPYEAYYRTERYQDMINLADKTLESTPNKGLPETYLWRGRANLKLGNQKTAEFDFKRALQWHPAWPPALAELKALGVEP